MSSLIKENPKTDGFLDCSREEDVRTFAAKFNVSPQAVKSAVRACCSNSIEKVTHYLRTSYLPVKNVNVDNRSQMFLG